MGIFEKASRMKLRYSTNRGYLSHEDLWDLSDEQLDNIYAGLSAHVQKQNTGRLLDTNRTDDVVTLKMSIVEHVFNVKQSEREANVLKANAREEFQRLLDIKARKQDAALEELSEADLDAKIAEYETMLS